MDERYSEETGAWAFGEDSWENIMILRRPRLLRKGDHFATYAFLSQSTSWQ